MTESSDNTKIIIAVLLIVVFLFGLILFLPFIMFAQQEWHTATTNQVSRESEEYRKAADYIYAERKIADGYRDTGEHEKALAAYLGILKNVSKEHARSDYAFLEESIASEYLALSEKNNPEENLENAIFFLDDALAFFGPGSSSSHYAWSQETRAMAYAMLADIYAEQGNYDKSISAYNTALEVYTFEKFPELYLACNINLGGVYIDRGEDGDRGDNLGNAVHAYSRLLNVTDKNENPREYAIIQMGIGGIYTHLGDVKNNSTERRRAEDAFAEAGKILTAEDYPEEYDTLQINLDEFRNRTQ